MASARHPSAMVVAVIVSFAVLAAARCAAQCASDPFSFVADRDTDVQTLPNGWSYELNLFTDETSTEQIGTAQVCGVVPDCTTLHVLTAIQKQHRATLRRSRRAVLRAAFAILLSLQLEPQACGCTMAMSTTRRTPAEAAGFPFCIQELWMVAWWF